MLKKVALSALLLMFGLIAPVFAADTGGPPNGLADLEERVAELESTVARKGNRKVSVTIYGQINKAILFHDLDVGSSGITKRAFGDGSQNPTAFGFMGSAKISPDVSAGFRIELGADENAARINVVTGIDTQQVTVRHSAIWLESSKVGRLTMGHTSTATDGIAEITTANTDVAAKMLNMEPLSSQFLLGLVNLPFDGGRRDIVRFDTNSLGGFIFSASWGQGDRFGPVNLSGETSNVWDMSVRYAGEFAGFRVAAGAGYRHEDYSAVGPLLTLPSGNTIAGSASVKHLTSGLFANAAYGKTTDFAMSGSGVDLTGMHGQFGWEKNVTGVGNTTIFGEWAQLKADMGGGDGKANLIGASAVQSFDAAAMDVYASWRQYDLSDLGMDDKVNVFMLGARLKF